MQLNRETIEKVRKSIHALSIENFYKNVAYFSGWIVTKPRIIKHDKTGQESVSLILVQFMRDSNGYAYYKTYNLISYMTPIIDMWKAQDKICFVICECQLLFNVKTHNYYPQVYAMEIKDRLPYELDEESES